MTSKSDVTTNKKQWCEVMMFTSGRREVEIGPPQSNIQRGWTRTATFRGPLIQMSRQNRRISLKKRIHIVFVTQTQKLESQFLIILFFLRMKKVQVSTSVPRILVFNFGSLHFLGGV